MATLRSASQILTAIVTLTLASATFAQSAPARTAPPTKILVVPFTALNVPESQRWIARGVQENLVAQIGQVAGYSPVAFHGQVVVEDNASAARLAKNANAALAIRGAVQVVGDNVRLTAQLIDARTGDTLRTASITGPAADLLRLEDDLAAQLQGISTAAAPPAQPTQPAATVPVASAPTPAAPTPIMIQQPTAPQVIVIAPQSSYPSYTPSYPSYPYYNDYAYGYGYPFGGYYGNYYPFLYTTTIINRPNHDHDHDHGHGRGGNGHGSGGRGGRGSGDGIVVSPQPNNANGLPIPTAGVGFPILNQQRAPAPSQVNRTVPTRTAPARVNSAPRSSGRLTTVSSPARPSSSSIVRTPSRGR